ncbi:MULTISPECIES: hypothetical protein [Bradyrhizobium]|uniref:hypothetical protein n=1 Tax=Bradyrhizobium TaxID=374 RepID=UPI00138AB2F1|nr:MULTISPECIES: hypothetical protein [Bradyrhizobium]GLR96150.1 hypothetical protein GCM10007858_37870 [Bradyrhizobium liaoningense]
MDDEVENLRLHGNGNLLAAQLAPVGIQKVVPEQKLHVENSGLIVKSGKQNDKMKFGSKIMCLSKGALGSSRLRDGSHAGLGGEYNRSWNVAVGGSGGTMLADPAPSSFEALVRCSASHASHLGITE